MLANFFVPILADGWSQPARRFQQTSGMVMAKGVEDCAFYRWSRLTSLNEVGGDPSVFAETVGEFHAAMATREFIRPRDINAFTAAAKVYKVYILVRRTNPASLKYIGMPGFTRPMRRRLCWNSCPAAGSKPNVNQASEDVSRRPKPSGMTPMIWVGCPSIRTVWPTMSDRPAKRRCHTG